MIITFPAWKVAMFSRSACADSLILAADVFRGGVYWRLNLNLTFTLSRTGKRRQIIPYFSVPSPVIPTPPPFPSPSAEIALTGSLPTTAIHSEFASYYYEYNINNHFLRTLLAAKGQTVNFYAYTLGWSLDPLGYGETMGYMTKISIEMEGAST